MREVQLLGGQVSQFSNMTTSHPMTLAVGLRFFFFFPTMCAPQKIQFFQKLCRWRGSIILFHVIWGKYGRDSTVNGSKTRPDVRVHHCFWLERASQSLIPTMGFANSSFLDSFASPKSKFTEKVTKIWNWFCVCTYVLKHRRYPT